MPNKKTAAQRQPYVDAMKGFGILCVVIGHFIEYHRGTAPGINALFTCIYLFHMAIFCTASGLVAKFSLRKLVTQQLWLYLISQAGITAFRAAALKDNIVDQGGWLQNVLLPWRHMWYLYALMFWMLTVPLLRAIQRRGLLASLFEPADGPETENAADEPPEEELIHLFDDDEVEYSDEQDAAALSELMWDDGEHVVDELPQQPAD